MRTMLSRIFASAVVALGVAPAWAIDVAPGDYRINPVGTSIMLLYLQNQSSDTFVLNGTDVPASELDVNAEVFRGLNYQSLIHICG